MQSTAAPTPWLEYFPQHGGPVQKSPLEAFPFSIGRNDTTNLPIQSTRVSREHAVIVRAGDTFRIRDLDSTNGTFVNGQRIEEATLSDGDIVAIADVEFTFFTGRVQAPRKTVTQVIGYRESDGPALKALDVVRSLRRLQETILQGTSGMSQRAIVELSSGKVVGLEFVPQPPQVAIDVAAADQHVLAAHPRISLRMRELSCLRAAEDRLDGGAVLRFLPLETADLDPGIAESYLDLVASLLPDFCLTNLVLEFPDSAVNDMAHYEQLYGRLRARGVRLCYVDFAAGKAQLDVHRKMPPDFLRLAPALVRGVAEEAARQAPLRTLLSECRRYGCEVIAPEPATAREVPILRQLGCRYGIGGAAGQPDDLAAYDLPDVEPAHACLAEVLPNAAGSAANNELLRHLRTARSQH